MTNHRIFKERLSRLIAQPSISSTVPSLDQSNRPVLEALAEWLETLNFDCHFQDLPGGKANLIAVLGQGDGGLVLSGHSDTVPYDESRWQSDPFSLSEREGKFFGLGTCDMKGFFPVVLAAIEKLGLKAENLKHPLIVLATADEESSMNGARALVKSQLLNARYAIIGEPTSLKPIRMHKGIAMERINVRGKSGHSSNPKLGQNAIEAMHAVIAELLAFRTAIQSKYTNPAFEICEPTMNLGCIHGGDNPNRICGECQLDFDIRSLPGMDLSVLRSEIDNRLQQLALDQEVEITTENLIGGVEAFEQEQFSELVSLSEKLSGAQARSVAFATEAPFLKALGMQTIVMGPGSIDQAHQPNEFLNFDQIEPAIDIIKAAIVKCCL